MPTVLENLTAARENYAQQLADLSDPAKRKPNYSVGGRNFQWQGYQEFLKAQIGDIDDLIAAEGSAADGGFTATHIR